MLYGVAHRQRREHGLVNELCGVLSQFFTLKTQPSVEPRQHGARDTGSQGFGLHSGVVGVGIRIELGARGTKPAATFRASPTASTTGAPLADPSAGAAAKVARTAAGSSENGRACRSRAASGEVWAAARAAASS